MAVTSNKIMIMATFKDIPGYEGRYQVSDEGEVRSPARTVLIFGNRKREFPEIIMKQFFHYRGYRVVWLRKGESKSKKMFVHRLVAECFLENPEKKNIVNHKDLDKEHNHLINLEWATESENTQHYYDNVKNDEPF